MQTYIMINGEKISLEDIAVKFGITEPIKEAALCQEAPAGTFRAVAGNGAPATGIDLELVLPKAADSLPIMLARAEQENPDEEPETPTVYLYSRSEEYVAFMPMDVRTDTEVDEEFHDPRITVSGDPGQTVQVFLENRYATVNGFPDPWLKGKELPF